MNHANPNISRLFSPYQIEARTKAHITHVLSALRPPLPQDEHHHPDRVSTSDPFQGLEHLFIEIDDLEEEDVIQHFPASNAFIQEGLDGGGGVLVHW